MLNLLKNGIRPKDILVRGAFENAIAGVACTGGSTNAVLHLLAIAREAGVPLHIDDFQTVSERTPLLADLKPAGRFVAADVDKAGGIPVIAKRLLDGKLVDGSRLTVTGKTFAEEASAAKETPGQEVVAAARSPFEKDWRAGRSPRKYRASMAAWPKSAGTNACRIADRPACSNPKRTPWPLSPARKSRLVM